jgi:hypothetical protein
LVTKATWVFVRERAKSRCEYCRAPEIITGGSFEVDLIVPQASSGGDEPENLALCCKSCNIRKGDHISGIDPESREETLLFNPRQDTWNEHFDFDAGRFLLLGRTPRGRATIDQLRMNTSYQIEARKYWVQAGLYPMKRVTLELGGKSPTILLDDAALDQAIPSALIMAFLNSGQACAAGTRLLCRKASSTK